MNKSSVKRSSVAGFLAIVAVSAATMMVLFWEFPLTTAIVTIAVVAALFVLGSVARSIEVEMPEMDRNEPLA